MVDVIPIVAGVNPTLTPQLAFYKSLYDKTQIVMKLSQALTNYANGMAPFIESEPDEEARYQLRLIKKNLEALVEGPVLSLFECYDNILSGGGDVC